MYGPQAHKQFLEKGYVRVVQDVRGKFKSEGKYVAFGDDMLDVEILRFEGKVRQVAILATSGRSLADPLPSVPCHAGPAGLR